MMFLRETDVNSLNQSPHTKEAMGACVEVQKTLKLLLDVAECAKEVYRIYELDESGDPDKVATDHHRKMSWGYLANALSDLEDK